MAYRDLRDYVAALEKHGKLRRVTKEVDKDWEIAAVCRQLFKKIPPARRPAVVFENVKGFDIPVVAGVLGASRDIYALGLETEGVEGINRKWDNALENPIPPRLVKQAPCKENILHGKDVDITKLPVPTWTVGEDPAPFFTSPYLITKDPETGVRNIGTYRMQVKGPNKTGLLIGKRQDMAWHIYKNNALNKPTPLAVVIGADPTIGYVSVSKMSEALDEFAVAGALRGEAVDLVPCETVPLEVPATAEIVLEGEIPPNSVEPEGPFGEYTGYMGPAGNEPFFNVKCMTFRNKPLYQAFISQMPAVGVELHSWRWPGVAALQAFERHPAASDQGSKIEGSRRQRRVSGHIAEKTVRWASATIDVRRVVAAHRVRQNHRRR